MRPQATAVSRAQPAIYARTKNLLRDAWKLSGKPARFTNAASLHSGLRLSPHTPEMVGTPTLWNSCPPNWLQQRPTGLMGWRSSRASCQRIKRLGPSMLVGQSTRANCQHLPLVTYTSVHGSTFGNAQNKKPIFLPRWAFIWGDQWGSRTHDNRNHNPGLYQLSYYSRAKGCFK